MVNQRTTTHIRIDRGMLILLRKIAKKREISLRELVEGCLAEYLALETIIGDK